MDDDMTTLKIAKQELRKTLRRRLSHVPTEAVTQQSRAIVDILFSLPEYQAAQRISIYLSMPSGEVSTVPIVQDALRHGKKVFVPYIHHLATPEPGGARKVMDMVSLLDWADYEALERDAWGIPTPTLDSIARRERCLGDAGSLGGEQGRGEGSGWGLDLVVMPGMGFDRGLRRLGHGKGFYDFFLQRYQHKTTMTEEQGNRKMPLLVGLALEEQLLPPNAEVPTNNQDWPLNALIVGDGTLIR
ncbi:5-formyltetrahydrofolate cyclo-ligase-like domain [Lasallia pustulata]|uniref:5-formyltetrahydrofolate cyclo-ligase n=1 Tax=Lasallia pustulata TaxID=136370 RepID=A0A1W5DCI2_9LECA|nr:5-formyltetrahydrofolate cyclo-ligase-like domain [Lasallia pustulata]